MKDTGKAPSEPNPVKSDDPLPPTRLSPVAADPSAQHQTDTLGVVSIVLAFLPIAFSQIVGFILGIIGVKRAKKEGRSPTVSTPFADRQSDA